MNISSFLAQVVLVHAYSVINTQYNYSKDPEQPQKNTRIKTQCNKA